MMTSFCCQHLWWMQLAPSALQAQLKPRLRLGCLRLPANKRRCRTEIHD